MLAGSLNSSSPAAGLGRSLPASVRPSVRLSPSVRPSDVRFGVPRSQRCEKKSRGEEEGRAHVRRRRERERLVAQGGVSQSVDRGALKRREGLGLAYIDLRLLEFS